MLKKLTHFTTTLLTVGLVVFSCMSLVAHAAAPPAFVSAAYDAATGILTISGTDMVSVTGKNNDIQLSKVTITDGLNHSYTLKSKGEISSATAAAITLTAAEKTGLSFLDKAGTKAISGGTYQINVFAGWNGASSGTDFGTHALTVSSIDKLTGTTYDMSTGILTITGDYISPVTGSRNDVSPKYITLSDGANHAYTLKSSNVEIVNTNQAKVTLNAADQIALQGWINAKGTASSVDQNYQFYAVFGWNGCQLGQMAFYPIYVSNYAGPSVSIKTSSVTAGSAITTAANGIVMSKPGYLYFVPSNTNVTGKTQTDLDALVSGGTAIEGTVTSVSKVSVPTSGKTVAFKLSGPSADLKAIMVDFAGSVSSLSDNVLTINNIAAPALTAAAAAGTAVDSTKVTAAAASGHSLAYQFSSASIATPKLSTTVTLATGTPAAGSIYAYTSDSNITGVSLTNKYVGVYELDSSLKVVKFKLITLTAANIKAPAFSSASANDKTLTISCDTLSGSSVPAAKAFTVKDGSTANAVTNVAIASDGNSVILTLTNSITAGHTITVAYSKPASGALTDAAGNAVASIATGKITVSTSSAAYAITGADITDAPGSDQDGYGVISLPAPGSGNHFVYKIKETGETLPYSGQFLSGWAQIANNGAVHFGANAAAANGQHVFVAELNTSSVVVKASDIPVSGIADYVAPQNAPTITNASIADKPGTAEFSYDGYGVLTLPELADGHSYIWSLPFSQDKLPKLGDTITSVYWYELPADKTIQVGSCANFANKGHVYVAELDGAGKVVKASDIAVTCIKDYNSTSGSFTGAIDFSSDSYVVSAINGTQRYFYLIVDGKNALGEEKGITINPDVTTLAGLLTRINNQLTADNAGATVSTLSAGGRTYLVFTSDLKGAASQIGVGGKDASLFVGSGLITVKGTDGEN